MLFFLFLPGNSHHSNFGDQPHHIAYSNYSKTTIDESRKGHIFRDKEGHFKEDNKENRREFENTANDPDNKLGTDQYGNDWYAKTGPNGKQTWTEVRNGKITNGGTNEMPKSFDRKTGLKRSITP